MKGRTLSCVWKRCLQETRRSVWRASIFDAEYNSSGFSRKLSTTNPSKESSKFEYETQVLSFGDGSNGALGHNAEGYLSDVFEPVSIQGLPKNVIKVAAGHYHSLALTDDGEVWAWGRNAESQLGRREGNSREDWRLPRRIEGLEDIQIKDVAGSGVVSMAIGNDGSLWSWGSSKRGQLGLAPNLIQSLLPQRVNSLSGYQLSQVALGWGHVLACTTDGELFAWGYGENGRLGFSVLEVAEDLKFQAKTPPQKHIRPAGIVNMETQKLFEMEKTAISVWRPCPVEALAHERVRSVACGLDHSLVLTDTGAIYSFGDDSLGQLGRPVNDGESIGMVPFPEGRTKAIVIAAGLGHSLAITLKSAVVTLADAPPSGNLYSWGWNSASQLGRSGKVDRPGLVEGLEEETLTEVKAGRVHSVGLTSNYEIRVWGSGRNGRLGLGSSADESSPFPIENLSSVTVLQVACGFDHSLLLVRARS